MAGMPWEDFANNTQSNDEEGPWVDFAQTQPSQPQPVNLSTDQTIVGGFGSPDEKPWAVSTQPTDKEVQDWATKEKQKQVEANPYFDKESGIDFSSPLNALKTLPVVRDLKNPWDLWMEESLPAHLVSAYKKGTFDKPVSELVKNAADEVKSISPSEIWKAAKKNPGKFGAEFINSVIADPELLLAPIGLGGKLVQNVERFGKTAKALGAATEAGIAAGAISIPISAAQQLDEKGYINPTKLAQDIGVNATMGAALGGVLGLAGHSNKPGNLPNDMATTMKFNMQEGDDLMTALNNAMKTHDVPAQQADDLSAALEKTMAEKPENWQDFTKPQAPAEKPLSFKEMIENLTNVRKTQETSTTEFDRLMSGLKSPEQLTSELSNKDFESLMQSLPKADNLDVNVNLPGVEKPLSIKQLRKDLKETTQKQIADAKDYEKLSSSLFKDAVIDGEFKTPQISANLKQAGIMDPELAKYIALTGAGAAIGGWYADDKAKGAAIGAALALGGPIALKAGRSLVKDLKASMTDPVEAMFGKSSDEWAASKKKWDETIDAKEKGTLTEFHAGGKPIHEAITDYYNSFKRDKNIANQMDDVLSTHEGIVAGTSLSAERLSHTIKKLVPDEGRRAELIDVIQTGRVPELQGNERVAAELFQNEMAEAGDFAKKAGIIDNLIEDGSYVTQLWKDERKAKNYYSSVSPTSRFAEDRLIPNYRAGMEMGLVPQTLDLAEIASIYGKSIGKTIANKQLLENIKTAQLPDGSPMIATQEAIANGKVPIDYVQIDHPQLRDLRVHPEIAPSLRHVFSSNNVPAYLQAMTAVSTVAKRGIFSFSGFHIKSLLDVAAGLAAGTMNPKVLTKIPSMYKMIKEGKAGDLADQFMQAGLKIESHSGVDMDNDFFRNIINTTEAAIKSVPGIGKIAASPITAVKKMDKGMQFLLWDYLHPAMKLSAASAMYEKALLKQSEILNKNPNSIVKSPRELQTEIAHATNDLFGGLNWRKVSDDVENKFLHDLASSAVNPQGLRVARIALLAPDWTVATARAGYKGAKSLLKTLTPGTKITAADDMYRRYFLGSALIYATIADGLQQAINGKHFWENDDPTYVDLGDGRKLQLSKHFMEPFHWLQHPGKALFNKMGYVPKELLSQAMGKEYITVGGGPTMKDIEDKNVFQQVIPRAKHALKGMAPITAQQTDLTHAGLGFVGLPIYGQTKTEKEQKRREASRDPETIRKRRERERARKLKRNNRG